MMIQKTNNKNNKSLISGKGIFPQIENVGVKFVLKLLMLTSQKIRVV